jgi:membrane-associated protease RseP (regulator of RpoE activity)
VKIPDTTTISHKNRRKGQIQLFIAIILAVFAGALAFTLLPLMLAGSSVSASTARLESEGYTVLTPAEYDTIISKLNVIQSSANSAVANAEAAVIAAQLATTKVDLFNSAERFVFPESTSATFTMASGGIINTFGAWTEITDNAATTLSASFATDTGYLSELTPFDYSASNKSYLVEIAYGASYTNVARLRWFARADELVVLPVYSAKIPAGETVYYRMMCETAGATCRAGLRYFYE